MDIFYQADINFFKARRSQDFPHFLFGVGTIKGGKYIFIGYAKQRFNDDLFDAVWDDSGKDKDGVNLVGGAED